MVRKGRKKASDASLLHPPPSVPRERGRACASVRLRGAVRWCIHYQQASIWNITAGLQASGGRTGGAVALRQVRVML